jgi:hypothetical protein
MFNTSKTFVKKTKKGKIFKVIKEHYLRDDIGTGVGDALESNASCFIIRLFSFFKFKKLIQMLFYIK